MRLSLLGLVAMFSRSVVFPCVGVITCGNTRENTRAARLVCFVALNESAREFLSFRGRFLFVVVGAIFSTLPKDPAGLTERLRLRYRRF